MKSDWPRIVEWLAKFISYTLHHYTNDQHFQLCIILYRVQCIIAKHQHPHLVVFYKHRRGLIDEILPPAFLQNCLRLNIGGPTGILSKFQSLNVQMGHVGYQRYRHKCSAVIIHFKCENN